MTQEQLDIIRNLIEDYDMFTDIFSDMGWAKTQTKYIKTPRLDLNASASFISFRFEKGFVCEHFTEAVTQVMVAAVCLCEGWDADKEWGEDHLDPAERRDMLTTYWGIPLWEHLEYKKLELTEARFEDMTEDICLNAVYDHETRKSRDYVLPDDVKAMFAYFNDVKLYTVGEVRYGGDGVNDWIAMKEDSFLWVRYSGFTD